MDERNPCLLLKGIQILRHAVLRLTDVDHQLRCNSKKLFQIDLAFTAVELTDHRHLVVLRGQILLGHTVPLRHKPHHLLRCKGEHNDLCQSARKCHFRNFFVHQHLASAGVNKHSFLLIGYVFLAAHSAAAGSAEHDKCQYKTDNPCCFHSFHPFIEIRIKPKLLFFGR